MTELVLANGYTSPVLIKPGIYACIAPLAYTASIITGKIDDNIGMDDRWCYFSIREASEALERWDGTGEPAGWHRHPGTGRRISQTWDEYDEDDKRVPGIGVEYRRP